MKIWSKGLGTMVLNLDFRNCYVELEDSNLLIKGQITDPVFWNYVITIQADDIRGCANLMFKPGFLLFGIRNFRFFFQFFIERIFNKAKFTPPDEKIEITGK